MYINLHIHPDVHQYYYNGSYFFSVNILRNSVFTLRAGYMLNLQMFVANVMFQQIYPHIDCTFEAVQYTLSLKLYS